MSTMYLSLQIPWSEPLSEPEEVYRDAGLVKTKGTLFMLPPDRDALMTAYTTPPRPRSLMSSGATALCKHFERGGSSSEHGRPHPFWPLPKGSNNNKNLSAQRILEKMFNEASWKNMMMLHEGVAVYEIRNNLGYGMRWTLEVQKQDEADKAKVSKTLEGQIDDGKMDNDGKWHVTKTIFRGFLEPIEGMNHELPSTAPA